MSSPSPPRSATVSPPQIEKMEIHPPVTEDPTGVSSTLWDWGDLLDFTVDDEFPLSFDSVENIPTLEVVDNNNNNNNNNNTTAYNQVQDRVRKRDPRLTCSNFLAGRVPCACPELDDKLREEEESLPGKKRVRTTRSNSGGIVRCQVPGCEADISELKGYHKRHRVCLRCANATSVLLDGHSKRYCQQCGKFHLLPDFDEGKRSCRRKLEKHNDRRRRKPHDSKGTSVDKDSQVVFQTEETACDGEAGKDCQIIERETTLVESEDGNISTLYSAPGSQNLNSDSGLSVGTPKDGGKDDPKFSLSPSNCDNKSFYSSVCPTGRISFKLYDWNPAEFPRRLRHQIFEWLSSMPVELEGYIRPGCTILTAFLAMPTFMWAKLLEDPLSYVHDFVTVPGKILSKRGPMFVYLNNMIFHVMKDGNSVVKVNMEERAPRLHYVHPTCFEAGKPIQFVACGSNLLQPKFRPLVSFSGKYLAYDYCVALPHGYTEGCSSLDHQLCKIFVRHTETDVLGPAFIEVENESGLSNFIPILIGNREICSEMKIIQQRFSTSHLSKGSDCEVSAQRQMAFSEFVLDIAWLLKNPSSENFQLFMSSAQIQRLNSLLNFLLLCESTAILDKILQNLKSILCTNETDKEAYGCSEANMKLLQKYVDCASGVLYQKIKKSNGLYLQAKCTVQGRGSGKCSESDMPSVAPFTSENMEESSNGKIGLVANSSVRIDEVPLLNREVIMNMNLLKDMPNQSCSLIFSKRVLKSRPTLYLIATVAVCFGVCAIILHPNQVGKFAVSIRRCLTDRL